MRNNWTNLVFLILIFATGCGSKKESGYSHLLKEKKVKIRTTTNLPIEYVFYRANDTLCKLYYLVKPSDLLEKQDSADVMQRSFTVNLKFQANQLSSKTLYTAERTTSTKSQTAIVDSLIFGLSENKSVFYELSIIDNNKHVSRTISSFWERDEELIPEDFLLIDKEADQILTQPFIENNELKILCERELDMLRMEVFSHSNPIATPLYQMEKNPLYSDSETPEVKIGKLKELNDIINEHEGEAYFRIRERSEEFKPSLTFTKLDLRPDQNINPLIYLLSEGSAISLTAWISFWNEASSGDTQKAEKLILEFNRRVMYANHHFSSHKIGWKTDRGMMYILLGPPDRISDDLRSEIWSYGFTSSISREFTFVRNPNGLNLKDYVLDRDLGYREIHLSGMERWKNGWVRIGWDGNQ